MTVPFNYNIYNEDGTIAYSYPTCYRKLAIDNYIDSMTLTDKTALISYESSAKLVKRFSNDKDMLKECSKSHIIQVAQMHRLPLRSPLMNWKALNIGIPDILFFCLTEM